MQPTLIIGLGGTGAHVVAGTLAKLLETPSTAEHVNRTIRLLCIDTDTHVADSLELPASHVQGIGFFALDYLTHACLHDENLKKWFDCAILRRAPLAPAQLDLTRSTAMYRQFGRLCLYHDLAGGNYSKVRISIHHTLSSIQQHNPDTPLVIICTSLIGGTGSAIALDVAYLVRHILATTRMNPHDCYIMGVFVLSNIFASAFSSAPEEHRIRFILNQVAAIREIQHFARTKYEFGPQGHVIAFDNFEPFNRYWLWGGDRGEKAESKWPTGYFPWIADEIADVVITGNPVLSPILIPPISSSYVNIESPLTTSALGDWPYWEDVYNRHLKDPNRLCPHISREFCK